MMNLWNANTEDLTKKTGSKEKFEKDGVYEVLIKEAYLTESTKSQAKAATFLIEDENHYGRLNLWHIKGNGEENEYARKALNRLTYLLKLKTENLKTETKKYKTFLGTEMERIYLPDFTNKSIGIILTVEHDMDQVNLDVKDFFDVKTKKTSDEIVEKREATTVESFRKKYANELEIPKNETTTVAEEEEDEFPF